MGRDVRSLVVDNAAIEDGGVRAKVRLGAETMWSSRAASMLRRRLAKEPADIVHFHNTFPLLSPSVHVAACSAGAAVVQTIHNFRPTCPAATLYRDGGLCHDCVGKAVAWPAVVHGCYRDSPIRTIPVAGMLAMQRFRHSWESVHAIVALTEFAAAELVAGGLPADRMHVKGNFVESVGGPKEGPGEAFLYVGRLTPEKGIDTIVEAVASLPEGIALRIAGDGPSEPSVTVLAERTNVTALGRIAPAEVRSELSRARALVFPSRWYEGMPIVILEAFATGVPVIAARIGAAAELVRDGETGITFEPGDADGLARAIIWAHAHPDEMAALGRAARRTYEARYTPDANYGTLVAIHDAALGRARSRLGASAAPPVTSGREP